MMTDPIADFLTRIRNTYAVKKEEVCIPYSRVKFELAELMRSLGYLGEVKKIEENKRPCLLLRLKYDSNNRPAIHHLERMSKPGRRVYLKKDALPKILNGYGIAIISTSHGIMTNIEAKKRALGGELICEIY